MTEHLTPTATSFHRAAEEPFGAAHGRNLGKGSR